MIDYEQFYSTNAKGMKKSEIRELLKLTAKPGVISFAGGLPAPDLFPVEEVRECVDHVMRTSGEKALQYGPTEGDMALREELIKYLKKEGIDLGIDQLFITTSSQQGLDLVAKVLADPGDIIMCGKPTYVGAIQAFNSYGAKMCPIDLDEQGIDTQKLDAEIKRLMDEGTKPKFIYVVPDFQNPSGITLNLERRKELIAIAEKYDLLIVEDSPYRQLRFEGEAVKPIISMNSERVLALYTFSKILLPGFRLGWMAGPKELVQKVIVAKQAVDLCAPPFNQAVLAEFMKRGLLEKQVARIIEAYRDKRDFMLEQLDKHMPQQDGVKWTRPAGGLFLWVTLPKHINTSQMFKEAAVRRKVAYVMGCSFDPTGEERNTMRLNFSFATKEQIGEGVKRLGDLIKEKI
ncbi:MAG: PLP-dependent aminotransferase family protein [bacterium]|nr:PLP-dependent aminotransferase family protein [bacterium]